jgi:hypothetical protein
MLGSALPSIDAIYGKGSPNLPPPPTMFLSDLVVHVPAQTEAISQLNPTNLCAPGLPYWEELWESLWGIVLESLQQEELVKRDDDPVDDCHILPDSLPPTRSVVTLPEMLLKVWRLRGRRILVRPEYYETEQAALLANENNRHVFAVTGQPGIGTRPFLHVPSLA